MNDTPGLDIALSTAGYLQTPDGTSLTRTTTQPTAARCDQLDATNSYDDYSEEQWFCFTTSEGVAGYLRIDDVIDGSNGAELTLSYSLFG